VNAIANPLVTREVERAFDVVVHSTSADIAIVRHVHVVYASIPAPTIGGVTIVAIKVDAGGSFEVS